MWYDETNDWVDLFIAARPASSKDEILGVHDGRLKVRIKAPAVEGSANKALVKFLAKRFKVPKSSVTIVSGENAKNKRVRLPKSEVLAQWIKEMTV